jgi:hypothetical protein
MAFSGQAPTIIVLKEGSCDIVKGSPGTLMALADNLMARDGYITRERPDNFEY